MAMTPKLMVAGAALAAVMTLVGCSQNSGGAAAAPPIEPAKQPEPAPLAPAPAPMAPTAVGPTVPEMAPVTPAPMTEVVDAKPLPAAKKASKATRSSPVAGKTYVVKKGDTLSGIAKAHHTTIAALKRLNPKINPDKILVGQKIVLASAS